MRSDLNDLVRHFGKPKTDRLPGVRGQLRRVHQSTPAQQRVIAKVSYSSPSKLKSHAAYIRREGAGVDGRKPEAFSAKDKEPDFAPIRDEERFFKIVISPENSRDMNLKEFTRDVMRDSEKCLGRKLEWSACVHENTKQPHVHVVVRGVSEGRPLVLDPRFITKNLREICQERATRELGPRSREDVLEERRRELTAERLTSIDRGLHYKAVEKSGGLSVAPQHQREKDRLEYLRKTGLAVKEKAGGGYRLPKDFRKRLQERGIRNDAAKTLHENRRLFKGFGHVFVATDRANISGKVVKKGRSGDRSYVVVKTNHDKFYYYSSHAVSCAVEGQNISINKGHVHGLKERGGRKAGNEKGGI